MLEKVLNTHLAILKYLQMIISGSHQFVQQSVHESSISKNECRKYRYHRFLWRFSPEYMYSNSSQCLLQCLLF